MQHTEIERELGVVLAEAKLLADLTGNEPDPLAVVGVVHADERNGGFDGYDHLPQVDGQVCGGGAHRFPPFRIGLGGSDDRIRMPTIAYDHYRRWN